MRPAATAPARPPAINPFQAPDYDETAPDDEAFEPEYTAPAPRPAATARPKTPAARKRPRARVARRA